MISGIDQSRLPVGLEAITQPPMGEGLAQCFLDLAIIPLVGGIDEPANLHQAEITADVEDIYLTDTFHLHFHLEIGLPTFMWLFRLWPF